MAEQPKKPESEDEEILHTFDMYHFFSRKDVILIIVLLVLLLAYVVFQTTFTPQAA